MYRNNYKQEAITLRRKGFTYSEILKRIPVAKSTLSLWLREVGLSNSQKQLITKKRLEAAQRGGKAKMEQRIKKTQEIKKQAEQQIDELSFRELWLMGVMLYWAEGSKEKERNPGSGVQFSNSDPEMISFFLWWLLNVCDIDKSRIKFSIYIHKNSKNRMNEVYRHWISWTKFSQKHFTYVYFKKHNPKTLRSNTGKEYYGNLVINVSASSGLNRKIAGWVDGINKKI